MSFSADIKRELCQLPVEPGRIRPLLSALFLLRGKMNEDGLVFQTGYAFIAKYVYMLLRDFHSIQAGVTVARRMNLRKTNTYRLFIPVHDLEKLQDLPIFEGTALRDGIPANLVRSEKNARAFLQGAFLASGSMNSPKSTNYHLELSSPTKKGADGIQKIMERFHLPVRQFQRHGRHLVYLKASDRIADFLSLIEASSALFAYEDIRIQRDFYNQFTRLDNCEVANEMKSIKAAREQLEWIELLEASGEILDEKIQHVVDIRKKNPEASIMELCNLIYLEYGEIISKSGMKHRLAKIHQLARNLEQADEE